MFNVLSVKIHSGVLDDVGQSLEAQCLHLAPGLWNILIRADTGQPRAPPELRGRRNLLGLIYRSSPTSLVRGLCF